MCSRLEGANVLDNIFVVQVLQQLYLSHDTLQRLC